MGSAFWLPRVGAGVSSGREWMAPAELCWDLHPGGDRGHSAFQFRTLLCPLQRMASQQAGVEESGLAPPPPAGQGDGSGGWAWEGPPGTRVTVGTHEALCPPSAGTGLAGSLEIRRHKRLGGCRDAAISYDPVPLAVRSRDASPALPHLLQDGGLGNGPMLASTEPRRPPPLGCRCVTL